MDNWPPERIILLRVLWDTSLSASQIGQRLGATKNAVVGKAHRLGLPSRPSPIRPLYGPPRPRGPRRRPIRRETKPTADNPLPTLQEPERPVVVVEPAVAQVAYEPVCACRWPLGDPKAPAFRFCEEPSVPGKSYCLAHCKIAYVPLRDLRVELERTTAGKRSGAVGTLLEVEAAE